MTSLYGMSAPLLSWYRQVARDLPWRKDGSPYAVWISEIMLQQTRVEAVKPYYTRFLNALPDPAALAACPDDVLYKLWQGLGYYRRAAGLKKCAIRLMEEYGGQLPANYEQLLDLPGIGPYTAGAIASIAFGLPVPAVDGNVLRVFSRLAAYGEDITLPAAKKVVDELVRQAMPKDAPGDFNQALMELGATVCLPKGEPKCLVCPVQAFCQAKENGCPTAYPVRPEKKPKKLERYTLFVLTSLNQLCLVKPKADGLLQGLYALPSASGHLNRKDAETYLHTLGITAHTLTPLPPARHIFTHIRWEMVGYLGQISGPLPKGWALASRDALDHRYAVPSAYARYVDHWKER